MAPCGVPPCAPGMIQASGIGRQIATTMRRENLEVRVSIQQPDRMI